MAWPAKGDGSPNARVTLLIVTPWPLATPGGTQRLVQGLASSLASHAGLKVLAAAGSGVPGTPAVPVMSRPIPEIRLPLVPVETRHWVWQRHGPAHATRLEGLEALGENAAPRAVLYTPHYSLCAEQTAVLAERLGVPLVLLPAIHLDQPLHTCRQAKQFYRSADLILCLSDGERDWLVNRVGVPPHRVLTIGCGWSGSALRRAPQWHSPEPLRLLTVGAYARHKRLDHQVEAVFRLRRRHAIDARLTVAGTLRDPAVLEELRRLVRQRGIDDAVRFVPDCGDAVIADLYAASHLFLFTSRSESFGVALLDSIGSGTWPVIYPHPVYRSLVESSGFGTIARRSSPKAVADAIPAALAVPVETDDESRLRWLATRSWDRLSAPFAAWCSGLERA